MIHLLEGCGRHLPQHFIMVRDNQWRGAGFSPLHSPL
jgi:hypothetical protein